MNAGDAVCISSGKWSEVFVLEPGRDSSDAPTIHCAVPSSAEGTTVATLCGLRVRWRRRVFFVRGTLTASFLCPLCVKERRW
jgi:hypothetical protein